MRGVGQRCSESGRKWTGIRRGLLRTTRTSPGRPPSKRSIWMDGRILPTMRLTHGRASRRENGRENILTVTTDHLKEGWIRRNGVPRSDKATVTTRLLRHGNYLTVVILVYDPVYLTEPFCPQYGFRLRAAAKRLRRILRSCRRKPIGLRDVVPHHLPGTNTFLNEFPAAYGIPPEATREARRPCIRNTN